MVHIFSVRYRESVDYFNISVEGDLEAVENELMRHSEDVKYILSRNKNKFDKGKRRLSNVGVIVAAEWKFAMRPISSKPGFQKTQLPVDRRHKVIEVADNG